MVYLDDVSDPHRFKKKWQHTAKFRDFEVKASAAKSARPNISNMMTRISVGNVESMFVVIGIYELP